MAFIESTTATAAAATESGREHSNVYSKYMNPHGIHGKNWACMTGIYLVIKKKIFSNFLTYFTLYKYSVIWHTFYMYGVWMVFLLMFIQTGRLFMNF